MDKQAIIQVLKDTAYVRTSGSPEEKRCAEYIINQLKQWGLEATLVPFEVPMAEMKTARLLAEGQEISCKGYFHAGNADLEAPLYYLKSKDKYSLSQCKGRIVLIDGYLRYWLYQDLLENGALGFISYNGHVNFPDRDIDQRELRKHVAQGRVIPGVNIHVHDAIRLVKEEVKTVKIQLEQREYTGNSHNVVLDIPGETDSVIALTAHYDSTSLSKGAFDNMTGSLGLMMVAKRFAGQKLRRGLRFIWCGSEERGLLGAKAYAASNEEALTKIDLCINLDMIGSIMGGFLACVTAEEKLMNYIEAMALEQGFDMKTKQDVYSSDSTAFADKGVPALSFARMAPGSTASIHCRYDTLDIVSPGQMQADARFIGDFTQRMASAMALPFGRTMPEKMKEELDIYLNRKRGKD